MTQTALDTNAVFPLNHQQWSAIQALRADLRPEQLQWLSGYFAGAAATFAAVPASAPLSADALTILYGSQTGNSKKVAERAAKAAEQAGLRVKLHSLADFRAAKLKQEKWVMLVISTHGEGDPPDAAVQFYQDLHSKRVSNLQGLKYSVLALGDSSYREFCKTGRDIDQRLQALGAEAMVARVDCDVAFDVPAEAWVEHSLALAKQALKQSTTPNTPSLQQALEVAIYHDSPSRPFAAPVLDRIVLNGNGSAKEVWHLELSLEDSGIAYQPGDALGILSPNDPQLVGELVQLLDAQPDDAVTLAGTATQLGQAFTEQLEITRITRPVLRQFAEQGGHDALLALFEPGADDELERFLDGRDWLDLLREFGRGSLDAAQLAAMMRPLAPRLYSIASSPSAYPDEVHLCIAAARWQALGRQRGGVASTYVADRLASGAQLPVYLHSNDNFRLPQDSSAPVIMIGPGTGVAPFRAFVEERQQLGHTGKNWLFFGEQHFRTDFLYHTDWLRWRKEGVLNQIDVAFSRDQAEKVYVQNRILEQAKQFYAWLQDGAYVYVCGDATRMARDVENSILQVIAQESCCRPEQAREYLSQMQQQRRYQRDVY